jgi:inhibitor of KinA sporulation pathway (predicted exonuclease)
MRKLFNVEFSGQEHRALVDAHAEAQILKKVASWGVGDVLGKSFESAGSSW